MTDTAAAPFTPPALNSRCVTFVVTGCVSAALVPFWMNWAKMAYPAVTFNATVTQAAQQFVSVSALSHLVNGAALRDTWDAALPGQPVHRDLVRQTDAWVIYPASLNTTSKLASGIADSPSLAALQTTGRPIVVAPAYPDGALENPIVNENIERLRSRPNIRFVGDRDLTDRGIDLPTIFATLAELEQAAT